MAVCTRLPNHIPMDVLHGAGYIIPPGAAEVLTDFKKISTQQLGSLTAAQLQTVTAMVTAHTAHCSIEWGLKRLPTDKTQPNDGESDNTL